MSIKIDPMFFQNPTGLTGVSVDEGESLWLPNGHHLRPIPKVWEEADPGELSPIQVKILAWLDEQNREPEDPIERMAWDLRKSSLKNARQYANPVVAHLDPSFSTPDYQKTLRSLARRDVLVELSDLED